MSWNDDQDFEAKWWGTCQNTYGEEEKQIVYAQKMGLKFHHNGKSPYTIDCHNQRILDVGGGAVSLLLKCENVIGKVIDPCIYPAWVAMRYGMAGIDYQVAPAEHLNENEYFDMCLCYNVLQHVIDPQIVVEKMRKVSKEIRIFEWIENGISPGHPHNLTRKGLDEWLGGVGKVEPLNLPTLKGLAYYGIFPT